MLYPLLMQLRKSQLCGDRPLCPIDAHHPIIHNGNYFRFADCDSQRKDPVPRCLCKVCGNTISILPEGMLPYRAVSVALLEKSFDARASGQPESAATEKEKGCLKRAWTRFTQRVETLMRVLGQMIEVLKPSPGKVWIQMRRQGNLQAILHLLGQVYKTSLLGDYQCLLPWRRKATV